MYPSIPVPALPAAEDEVINETLGEGHENLGDYINILSDLCMFNCCRGYSPDLSV